MLSGFVVASIVSSSLGVAGCRRDEPESSPEPGCTELAQAHRQAKAEGASLESRRPQLQQLAQTCAADHARTGSPEAGVEAARAHLQLDDLPGVITWAETLRGTTGEGSAWAFVALGHERKAKDFDDRSTHHHAATEAYERALAAFEGHDDHRRATKAALGLVKRHWAAERLRPALVAANTAVVHAQAAGDAGLEGQVALDIVAILLEVGDIAGARWALSRAKMLVPDDDAQDQMLVALAESNLRLAERRPSLAQRALTQLLARAQQTGDDRRARFARFGLLEVALDRGDLDNAEDQLRVIEASASERVQRDHVLRSTMHHHAARIAAARGRVDDALHELDQALADDPPPIDTWAWQLHYERGRLLAERGRVPEARASFAASIEVVERLRQTLAGGSLRHFAVEARRRPYEAAFALEAGEGQVEAAVAMSERARARSFLDAFATAPDVHASGSWRVEQTLTHVDRLRALTARGEPTSSAQPRPLSEVMAALSDVHALAYFEANGVLWVIASRAGSLSIHRVEEPLEVLENRVDAWLEDLDNESAGRAVAEAILPPELLPPPGTELYVVPDGLVASIPFAALPVSDRVLAQLVRTSQIPSLTSLAAIRARSRDRRPTGSLVLGDAGGDLPAARAEALHVAHVLGVEAHLGDDATQVALANARGTSLLHLAVHGGLDERGAWVELAEGRLHASDLALETEAPRQVVLASCASAARRGRGLWGSVAAAFIAAGSTSVLASLWSVDDADARRFIEAFYANGGVSQPGAALAATQRSFLAAGEPISTWSAFVMMGVFEEQRR